MRFALITLLLSCLPLSATLRPARADPRDYAVEVSAVAQESPPRLVFTWPADPAAERYHVFKKEIGDTLWGEPIALLDGDETMFSDGDIAVGEAFDYSFRKSLSWHNETVAVPPGAPLTFTIHDAWGDGMCCHHGIGSYRVSAGAAVFAEGGEFGASESTHFDTGIATELRIDLVLDVYGQETTWELRHDTTGERLAAGGPYSPPRFGHICAGIRYPAVEDRGAVLVVINQASHQRVAGEIERLRADLIGDGYRVRLVVQPDGYPVAAIRSLVLQARAEDPELGALLLLGDLPVPYSGDIRAAHANHQGAWPADVYYGELDGVWTDDTVDNTTASRPENHNVPGDGKFDQTFLTSDMDLQVGRVDLTRLPAFDLDQYELLRRYLDKNHAFRTGQFQTEARGLIDDNVGDALGLAFAATGWRNFTAMFGTDQVHAGDYLPTLETASFLWAYGCGGSSYIYCGGVASTADFATRTINAVFSPLYGSYFGDWDNENNVLRAPLAAAGQPLACFWAGLPVWHLQHMALGFPIGYSTAITQNNTHQYTPADGSRQIRIALMGDPTLRMYPVAPVVDLTPRADAAGAVQLAWTASPDAGEGYHVYRAAGLDDRFVRLNAEPIAATTFTDQQPLPGANVYMVRALKLETTGSGTFLNLSCGAIDSVTANTGVPATTPRRRAWLSPCFPNPFNPETRIRFHLPAAAVTRLCVFTTDGRLVRTLVRERLAPGWHEATWDGRDDRGQDAPSGVYLCRLAAGTTDTGRMITLLK